LIKWGVPEEKIKELDWWQEITIKNNVRLVSTPTRYFSG
jgi:L-ascorbate metabolism protein UlaG (beta-lactamase superfamily)